MLGISFVADYLVEGLGLFEVRAGFVGVAYLVVVEKAKVEIRIGRVMPVADALQDIQ